jgi:hypothetical protein
MLTAIFFFFLGVFLAPVVRPLLRPFATEVMKFFVTVTYELRTAAARAREEMEDAVAAAEAERAAKQSAATAGNTQSDASKDASKAEPNKSSLDGA